MSYTTAYFTNTLRAARERKGLSQRELSQKVGLPQSHISKIENGTIDLRLSSLVALAHVLDLEPTLVPRKAVSAVQSIIRSSTKASGESYKNRRMAQRALKNFQETIEQLAETHISPENLAQLQRQIRELQLSRLTSPEIESIRVAHRSLKPLVNSPNNPKVLRHVRAQLQSLIDTLKNSSANGAQIESVRPAYSLDDEGDDV